MIGSLHTQSIADSTQYNNLVYSGGINANFKNIDLFILYGQGKIKNIVQNQITGGLTIYPTKNQNLYLNSVLTYHKDNEVENTIFYQKVGLRLGNKIWVETYGSFGDMKNVQEFDGFYLYNINDHLIRRIGLTGIFTLGQSTRLLIGYSSENFEETSTRFPYKQHYIFTGLHILLKK